MAHLEVKFNKTKKGLKWSVYNRFWNTDLKKHQVKKITPTVFKDLGFNQKMTLNQARDHAKKINSVNSLKRKEQQKKVKASENLHHLISITNDLFPALLTEQFIEHVTENWWGGDYNLKKTIQHFAKVQSIITELHLLPSEYFKKKNAFYKYFANNQISVSYMEKLIKVINQWGEFYSESTLSYFKKLPYPKGLVLEKIRANSKVDGKGAYPLSVKILQKLTSLPKKQYEYIHATFYFGLRPSELDTMLKDPTSWKVTVQDGTKVLHVRQNKLQSVDAKNQWKLIPIILEEQNLALKNIQNKNMKKPLAKTMKTRVPEHPSIGLYSGRKGFTNLMLDKNQKLENISMWMGHKSLDRTYRTYTNKHKVTFTPLKVVENE